MKNARAHLTTSCGYTQRAVYKMMNKNRGVFWLADIIPSNMISSLLSTDIMWPTSFTAVLLRQIHSTALVFSGLHKLEFLRVFRNWLTSLLPPSYHYSKWILKFLNLDTFQSIWILEHSEIYPYLDPDYLKESLCSKTPSMAFLTLPFVQIFTPIFLLL